MYNRILEQVLLPLSDTLMGTHFIRELKKFRKFDTYSSDALEQIQKERLANLLSNAVNNSPYYSQFKNELDSDNIFDSLRKFPILTKDILRKNENEIFCKPKESLTKLSSSGSSGVQSTIYLSKEEHNIIRAQQVRGWE